MVIEVVSNEAEDSSGNFMQLDIFYQNCVIFDPLVGKKARKH